MKHGRLRVVLAAVSCALASPAAAVGANQAVGVTNNVFTPAAVTVNQGDQVTWNNTQGFHNVRFDDDSYIQPPSAAFPPWTVSRTFTDVGTFRYYCDAHGDPGGIGMSGAVTVNAVAYPRPGGATPLRVPLVPEFSACTSPNNTHASPLDSGSCSPAAQQSSLLTIPTTGAGAGNARLRVIAGDTGTMADEADLEIISTITGVRRRSDGATYSGRTIFDTTVRLTDKANGASGLGSATVQDTRFSLPMDCVNGACGLSTTADSLVPGYVKEGKRAVVQVRSVNVMDVGADGGIGPPACAPNCGTGDEKVFLRQGVFAP